MKVYLDSTTKELEVIHNLSYWFFNERKYNDVAVKNMIHQCSIFCFGLI